MTFSSYLLKNCSFTLLFILYASHLHQLTNHLSLHDYILMIHLIFDFTITSCVDVHDKISVCMQ